MTLERKIARAFAMDNKVWLRHAHPLSVISRFTLLPILIIAFWSRFWFEGWAVIPVALAILWTWGNPRIFPAPISFEHWTSKTVLGERVWMNRDTVPVPIYHRTIPHILSGISGIGMLLVLWGVFVFDVGLTVLGTVIVYFGKLWFLDRMVWLWQDMQDAIPEYQSWPDYRRYPPDSEYNKEKCSVGE